MKTSDTCSCSRPHALPDIDTYKLKSLRTPKPMKGPVCRSCGRRLLAFAGWGCPWRYDYCSVRCALTAAMDIEVVAP